MFDPLIQTFFSTKCFVPGLFPQFSTKCSNHWSKHFSQQNVSPLPHPVPNILFTTCLTFFSRCSQFTRKWWTSKWRVGSLKTFARGKYISLIHSRHRRGRNAFSSPFSVAHPTTPFYVDHRSPTKNIFYRLFAPVQNTSYFYVDVKASQKHPHRMKVWYSPLVTGLFPDYFLLSRIKPTR